MPRNRQPTPLIPVRWKVNLSTAAASLPKLAAFVFQQDLTSNKVIKCCCVSKRYTLGVAVLFLEEIRFGGHFFYRMVSMALDFCKQKTVCFSLRLKVTTVAGHSPKKIDICQIQDYSCFSSHRDQALIQYRQWKHLISIVWQVSVSFGSIVYFF